MYCMECGGKLVLNENGELVCSVCGLVHVENRIREESYILANRITAQGYTPAPLELGTFLSPACAKKLDFKINFHFYSKLKRMSRLNLFSKVAGDKSMHYRVHKTLYIAAQKVGLPKYVVEYAYALYLKFLRNIDENLNGKLNHYRISAACLIASSRKHGFSIRVSDILKVYQDLGHRVTKSNLMEAIFLLQSFKMYEKPSVADRIRRIIPVITKRILSDERVKRKVGAKNVYLLEREICQKAMFLLHKVDPRKLQGKNPHILALALFYVVFIAIYGKRVISQGYISKKFGCSLSAFRNNVKYIYSIIGAL